MQKHPNPLSIHIALCGVTVTRLHVTTMNTINSVFETDQASGWLRWDDMSVRYWCLRGYY